MLNLTKKKPIKATISFHHEHGVFLSDKLMNSLKLKVGDPVSIEWQGLVSAGICKGITEIDPMQEAIAIFALFEDVVSNHYSFLNTYGITKKLLWKKTHPFSFNLGDVYFDLKVNKNSFFTFIHRKLEDTLIELDHIPPEIELPGELHQAIESSLEWLAQLLSWLYRNAECVLGAGHYLSHLLKNVELAFGVSEMELSYVSKIGYKKPISINPYILYWLVDSLAHLRQEKLCWNYFNPNIGAIEKPHFVPITKLIVKTYIVSQELWPYGADKETICECLHNELIEQQPFIFTHDILFPLSCPSLVLEEHYKKEKIIPYVISTPYGPVPSEVVGIPKLTKETEIEIHFFDFPLYNKNRPVVLDTSAIDVSRFPFYVKSPFFRAFMENRRLIMPAAVLYELKTRYPTSDQKKVNEALTRMNNMQNWGYIKDITLWGEVPRELRVEEKKLKKYIEDVVDTMVLQAAIENNAVLFTNDSDLAKLALARGVYPISYNGLEDDIRYVISSHDLEYDKGKAVKATQEYAQECRGITYEEEDIRIALETLISREEVEIIKIRGEKKLHFRRRKPRKT